MLFFFFFLLYLYHNLINCCFVALLKYILQLCLLVLQLGNLQTSYFYISSVLLVYDKRKLFGKWRIQTTEMFLQNFMFQLTIPICCWQFCVNTHKSTFVIIAIQINCCYLSHNVKMQQYRLSSVCLFVFNIDFENKYPIILWFFQI